MGKPKCFDRTPKFCEAQKRLCNFKKYEKTMKYKCGKTCGFCSGAPVVAVEETVPTQAPTTNAQFGPWSKWSKCSVKKTKYQKRKRLVPPCTKRQLYNVQK